MKKIQKICFGIALGIGIALCLTQDNLAAREQLSLYNLKHASAFSEIAIVSQGGGYIPTNTSGGSHVQQIPLDQFDNSNYYYYQYPYRCNREYYYNGSWYYYPYPYHYYHPYYYRPYQYHYYHPYKYYHPYRHHNGRLYEHSKHENHGHTRPSFSKGHGHQGGGHQSGGHSRAGGHK